MSCAWCCTRARLIVGDLDLIARSSATLVFGELSEFAASGELRLPVDGVAENQKTITIAATATEGPVLPTSVMRTQAVGVLSATPYLSFEPPIAGGSATLRLQGMTFTQELQEFDLITVSLPGFSGNEQGPVPIGSSALIHSSWESLL